MKTQKQLGLDYLKMQFNSSFKVPAYIVFAQLQADASKFSIFSLINFALGEQVLCHQHFSHAPGSLAIIPFKLIIHCTFYNQQPANTASKPHLTQIPDRSMPGSASLHCIMLVPR